VKKVRKEPIGRALQDFFVRVATLARRNNTKKTYALLAAKLVPKGGQADFPELVGAL
jgi:hypothetical protein